MRKKEQNESTLFACRLLRPPDDGSSNVRNSASRQTKTPDSACLGANPRMSTALGHIHRMQSLLARRSIQWGLLALAAAALLVTAFKNYQDIDKELTAVTLSRREAIAQLMAVTLEERFDRLVDIAISLSTQTRLHSLVAQEKWTDALEFLRSVPRNLPQIERLFLADVHGILKADIPALPGVRGKDFSHREWFRGVSRNWQPYVSPAYTRSAVPQMNVFAVAVPIKKAKGDIAGILVLQIRIENLLKRMQGVDLGPGGFIYILDSHNQIAFHSKHPERKGMIDASMTPILARLHDGENGVDIAFDPMEQEESILAYAPLSRYGWSVVIQQPTRASIGLVVRDEQLRRLSLGYVLILLFSAMAIFLVSRMARARERAREDQRMRAELEQRIDERTRELQATNHFLDSLIENIPHTIFVKDADTLQFIRLNRAGEELLGYARTDLLGKSDYDFFPKEQADFFVARDRAVLARGTIEDIPEEPVDTRTKGTRILHTKKVAILDAHGRPRNLLGISEDVTEQKEKEKEIQRLNMTLMQRNIEIESINKELQAFSYSVSHDLRAPLRSIDGFSQALLEDCRDKLDAQGVGYLRRVREATQRMGELIDDILMLSRVSRAEIRKTCVDLHALSQSVVMELRDAEPHRKVDIVIESGLSAQGDAALLRVMLENLWSNAWKFTAKTKDARIEFGRNTEGFFLRDNGAGFDMAYVDKLFGAFQRLHTPSEFAGTGIGLATVQRIVHRHGGQVRAEGCVGQGATFHFTLPNRDNQQEQQSEEMQNGKQVYSAGGR